VEYHPRRQTRGRGSGAPPPDSADRRATRIAITDAGIDMFRSAAQVHLAGIAHHFADKITTAEARALAEILERVGETPNAS